MSDNKYYPKKLDDSLDTLFSLLDEKNKQINQFKKADSDLWKTILFRLKVDWTYNSNSIEGSSLSEGETLFFLGEGLTVEGKSLKDHLDAQNHAEAIDLLFDVVANQRELSESLIKEVNVLLLHGVKSTSAMTPDGKAFEKKATPGAYKTLPNHVLLKGGGLHKYIEPLHVPEEMETLIRWINDNTDKKHPCYVASVAHYNMTRIHPFDDGNDRGARVLMNLILLKAGYFPAVVRVKQRREYIEALQKADNGDLTPFVKFIAKELTNTLEALISDVQKLDDNRPKLKASRPVALNAELKKTSSPEP